MSELPELFRFLVVFAFPLLVAAMAVEAIFGERKERDFDEDDYPGPF